MGRGGKILCSAAVLAVVVEAGLRISRRALRNRAMVMIAVVAFIGIFVMKRMISFKF